MSWSELIDIDRFIFIPSLSSQAQLWRKCLSEDPPGADCCAVAASDEISPAPETGIALRTENHLWPLTSCTAVTISERQPSNQLQIVLSSHSYTLFKRSETRISLIKNNISLKYRSSQNIFDQFLRQVHLLHLPTRYVCHVFVWIWHPSSAALSELLPHQAKVAPKVFREVVDEQMYIF